MLWLMLLLIFAFLAGTFLYSWRLLKRHSRREEAVDRSKLRRWEDEDD